MRRKTNPMVIIGMIVIVVLAFVVAYLVKRALPETVGAWKNLIYWLIVTGIDLSGGMLVGRVFGKRR